MSVVIFIAGCWVGSFVTAFAFSAMMLGDRADESAGSHVPPEAGYSPRVAPLRRGAHLPVCGND
jgi:hypothetical protein